MENENVDKVVEVFFDFLKHMENITDVMVGMARGLKDLDKRVDNLEHKPRRKNEDDER